MSHFCLCFEWCEKTYSAFSEALGFHRVFRKLNINQRNINYIYKMQMAAKALPPAHFHFSRVPVWPEDRKWLKDHPSEESDCRWKVSWQDFQIDIERVQDSTNWRYGCESSKCLALKLPLVILGRKHAWPRAESCLTMSLLLPLTGLLLGFCCNPFRPWGGFPHPHHLSVLLSLSKFGPDLADTY